jgi:hypothetical protein
MQGGIDAGSRAAPDKIGGFGKDISQPGRGRQIAERYRIDPDHGIGFLACFGFAGDPAPDEGRDHIMRLDAAAVVADDRFDMVVEGDDFGLDADLLVKLPQCGFAQGLADFHDPAGQGIEAEQRRPRAPRDERAPLTKYSQRHRKDRTRRIKAVVQGGTSK